MATLQILFLSRLHDEPEISGANAELVRTLRGFGTVVLSRTSGTYVAVAPQEGVAVDDLGRFAAEDTRKRENLSKLLEQREEQLRREGHARRQTLLSRLGVAHCLVAELTAPCSQAGAVIQLAVQLGKPVLILRRKAVQLPHLWFFDGDPQIRIVDYQNLADLGPTIEMFFRRLSDAAAR